MAVHVALTIHSFVDCRYCREISELGDIYGHIIRTQLVLRARIFKAQLNGLWCWFSHWVTVRQCFKLNKKKWIWQEVVFTFYYRSLIPVFLLCLLSLRLYGCVRWHMYSVRCCWHLSMNELSKEKRASWINVSAVWLLVVGPYWIH